MKQPDDSSSRWEKLSASLRTAGLGDRPRGDDLSAPPGFATRVVSRTLADQRADQAGLGLWRRWSLLGAATAVLLLGTSFLIKPEPLPARQIIPVPALDELPTLSKR